MIRAIFFLLKAILLLVFPFILLIRGSVFLSENYNLIPWLSILGGVLITSLVLMLYFFFFFGKLTKKMKLKGAIKRKGLFALVLVIAFTGHSLFFIQSRNVKHPELKEEFRSLHPILRLGISTIAFIDRDLVITDAQRVPEDYNKMGLKVKNHSLHYVQSSGYSHAIDLRTNGRSEFRNKLIGLYFRSMGFNTLRHVGTADHWHISIDSKDRPGGI